MSGAIRGPDGRRLYQQVAEKVRDLIRSGQFAACSRLPGECDLAQQIGVSRPSLREGLIALEVGGSVEIRMGSGVYICPVPSAEEATRAMGERPSELIQARAVPESTVAALAAARMTPEALEEPRDTLHGMRAHLDASRERWIET